ncbi:MAG: FG-GAP-like repeat-containing protein, partial [bacterium]
ENLGNWKFKDITERAGVACPNRFSNGVTFADIDGDSDLDLLVTALGGPNACFLNDGTGKFTEVTESVGLKSDKGSTSIALADIDGDADLDIYMTNFKPKSVESIYPPHELRPNRVARKVGDSYEIVPKFKEHYRIEKIGDQPVLLENPDPDFLYLNDGTGHFRLASLTDSTFLNEKGQPLTEIRDWGLLARLQDMDNDGDPDIYVCDDYWSPDRTWINDGKGRFRAIDKFAIRHTSKFTMAMDLSDIDRDGDLDFMLIDMLSQDHQRRMRQLGPERQQAPTQIGHFADRPQLKRNTLFLNRGDNTYTEIGQISGVQATEWTWSIRFIDVDLDGYEDIIATNGQQHDFEDADTNDRVEKLALFGQDPRQLVTLYPDYPTPNVAFRNNGDLTFDDVSQQWGFTEPDIAWGMAFADFDNDGDLDIATNRLHQAAGIYRNETSAPRISVRLRGDSPNTQGIGAKIKVINGKFEQQKEVISGGTYLSGSDPMFTFAAGDSGRNLAIEVTWRNGKKTRIDQVSRNRIYEIFESPNTMNGESSKDTDAGLTGYFEDVSFLIHHRHNESPFDDFKRQPLLPIRLSQLGPGVAWYDIDGDEDDDLIISGGSGGNLSAFQNNGGAGFAKILGPVLTHDQTSVLGWRNSRGVNAILAGCSNLENMNPGDAFIERYVAVGHALTKSSDIPGDKSSIGPMAMADFDGDGDLDLFVGGRYLPGRYPEPASSRLYRQQRGDFILDEISSQPFQNIGLVSGAVFSDLDADGDPDLILAIEWGAVMVFLNRDGQFEDATSKMGLADYKGRWNGVTTGDLDEDGKLDIIATNWGLNTEYQYDAEHPLLLYYKDFDSNGTHLETSMNKIVPERAFTTHIKAVPYIRSQRPTHKSFAAAGIDDLLGKRLQQAQRLEANTLEHMIFFNRGKSFKAVPLPSEAQFAPAFYVGMADFDGDGHEDVFISQNFFAMPNGVARQDGGRGLWMRGDGTGALVAVPGQDSGVKVYGEQRGAALSDFDRDGRVDLVVTQNGAETKLFRNTAAKPGLRIRLKGGTGNPFGVGASLRLIYDDGYGPIREIHAGSGYLSQDSAVQIMGVKKRPKGVWVRWPGGKVTTSDLTAESGTIIINIKGQATILH